MVFVLAEAVREELGALVAAGEPGSSQARAFLEPSQPGARALEGFGADGSAPAAAARSGALFNDYYKFSMLPVIRALERDAGGDVHVVFALNVRSSADRAALDDDARRGGPLLARVARALHALRARVFARDDPALLEDGAGCDARALDALCGEAGEPARPLVDAVCVRAPDDDALQPSPSTSARPGRGRADGRVVLCAYVRGGRLHVEAGGPWHRVTMVETPLMQAVYAALLDQRRVARGEPRARWLARALCRCARAVDAVNSSGLRAALFAGRRCAGLDWLVLQNAYCAAHLRRPLGTSSVSASAWLRARALPSLQPAGTHAHELSLVLAALQPGLDELAGGCVATQCLGHALYLALGRPRGDARPPDRHALMPLLSDTLRTRAFLETARAVHLPAAEGGGARAYHAAHRGVSVLGACGGARHDSGDPRAFRDRVLAAVAADAASSDRAAEAGAAKRVPPASAAEGGAPAAAAARPFVLLASDVGSMADLEAVRAAGFDALGAGGFFGESEGAWPAAHAATTPGAHSERPPPPQQQHAPYPPISLAVKPVAVWVRGERTRVHPVKLGDGERGDKFEADATLSAHELAAARERAEWLSRCAERGVEGEAAAALDSQFGALVARVLAA